MTRRRLRWSLAIVAVVVEAVAFAVWRLRLRQDPRSGDVDPGS